MLLAIDAGNTNIVFAVFDGEQVRGEWRASTDTDRTADELGVWLMQLLTIEGMRREDIQSAIIASVVPAMVFSLKTLCRRYFGCDPVVVGSEGVDLGINILLDRPEEVGADRLVNAVAAHQCYDGPMIVIDFGTATTFDVVDEDGNYCGGAISPGINLSLEALHMAAAALPHVDVTKPARAIGTNTVACMQSGVYWGYVGLIEGIVREVRRERPRPSKVIGTGGLAALFAQGTDIFDSIEDDLTMHGLVLINDFNKETA